jgi:hypothetical protein
VAARPIHHVSARAARCRCRSVLAAPPPLLLLLLLLLLVPLLLVSLR